MTQDSAAFLPCEDRTWSLLVGLMTWLPAALDARLTSAVSVTHVEYQVLRLLALSENRALHMTPLANAASVTPSHLTRIVARLEKRSLVARTPDPKDGRFTLAQLTEDGAQTVTDSEATYKALVRELVFNRLEEQQVQELDIIAEQILLYLKPECVPEIA